MEAVLLLHPKRDDLKGCSACLQRQIRVIDQLWSTRQMLDTSARRWRCEGGTHLRRLFLDTSPVDGLQNEQYDDGFCFTFENFVFQYKNNSATVNPWNGYQAEAYDPGVSTFEFLEGTGTNNRDQIVLTDEQFMGVWDCDNVLDIVQLTATKLVVRGKQTRTKRNAKGGRLV